MRRAVLYTLILLGANAGIGADVGMAGTVDPALITGAMEKLVIETPKDLPSVTLKTLSDGDATLPKGSWQVVNLWATWCVPCREEMPALNRMADWMPNVKVTAVAVGPQPVPAVQKFLGEIGVKSLSVLRDPSQDLARQMGVLGLPVTVIVNPQGEEVARLIGGADWSSPEAKAVMAALMQ